MFCTVLPRNALTADIAADSNVTVVEFNRVQRVRNCVPIDAEQCIFKAAVTGAVVNGLSVINEFYRRISVWEWLPTI